MRIAIENILQFIRDSLALFRSVSLSPIEYAISAGLFSLNFFFFWHICGSSESRIVQELVRKLINQNYSESNNSNNNSNNECQHHEQCSK